MLVLLTSGEGPYLGFATLLGLYGVKEKGETIEEMEEKEGRKKLSAIPDACGLAISRSLVSEPAK